MRTTSPFTTTPPRDHVWTIETATSGPGIADDHINLKTDSSGRVYAATKTNLSGSGATVRLLVRTAGGSWVIHVYGTAPTATRVRSCCSTRQTA